MEDKTKGCSSCGNCPPETKTGGVFWKEFTKVIVISNPIFILALGLCPALAVTGTLNNALGMGGGVLFVLLGANIVISMLRNAIPSLVRIPIFIVVIATFVTILGLLFEAYIPPLHESLGIYLPLIVVNCIILGRAEVFASRNKTSISVADALGIGVGFTIAIIIISLFREILGTGALSIFRFQIFSIPVLSDFPVGFFVSPPGAFLVIGVLLALFRVIGVMDSE